MKLRQRVLIWMGVTLLAISACIYLVVSNIITSSFHDLEQVDLRRNVQRVSDAIDQQIQDLHESSIDWSAWDDSYQFMADHNRAYYQSNLSTLSLKVDVILFVDQQGRYFDSKTKKRLDHAPEPNARQLLADLGKKGSILQSRQGKPSYSGLITHQGVPMMVSVQPITDTAMVKAPRGRIVFGLYLDETAMQSISTRTHLIAKTHLSSSPVKMAAQYSESEATGFASLTDIHGNTIGAISATTPRLIYSKGRQCLAIFSIVLMGVSLALILVTLGILDLSVLARVRDLSEQLKAMSDHENPSDRLVLRGDDELGWLAGRINDFIQVIKDKRESLIQTHAELQTTVTDLALKNAILENAVEGISQLDKHGRIVSCNLAFAKCFGLAGIELKGKHWEDLCTPAEASKCLTAFVQVQTSGKEELNLHGVGPDGVSFYVEASLIASYQDDEFTGCHLFVKDATERRRLELDIEHQAFHDVLTELPNRKMFMDRLESACMVSTRLNTGIGVIFIDMDNFKVINDSLGHEAGDRLLVAFAERLSTSIDKGSLARIGGDEFTILLDGIDSAADAEVVAGQVITGLAQLVQFNGKQAFVSVSMGIAYCEPGRGSPEGLLRDADTAMYEAKDRGKGNYVTFDPAMSRRAVDRLELELGLREAIERDEFILQFQPIIDLKSHAICGMESLVRWEHPTRGIVSPGVFIPIAEETGLINEIGAWVLEQSCRQLNEWKLSVRIPDDFRLSVNLSGRQLQRPDIVDEIAAILAITNTSPSHIKLEITESVLMFDIDETIRKLHELKALGVYLAIDDFGTGYSSMSSLSRFPLDTVKIDRCFVSRLGEKDADAVISAIIMLSQKLNCDVTAEGLEESDQLVMLNDMGCTNAQGFLFDRPLNKEDALNRLEYNFAKLQVDAA